MVSNQRIRWTDNPTLNTVEESCWSSHSKQKSILNIFKQNIKLKKTNFEFLCDDMRHENKALKVLYFFGSDNLRRWYFLCR